MLSVMWLENGITCILDPDSCAGVACKIRNASAQSTWRGHRERHLYIHLPTHMRVLPDWGGHSCVALLSPSLIDFHSSKANHFVEITKGQRGHSVWLDPDIVGVQENRLYPFSKICQDQVGFKTVCIVYFC